MPILVRLVDLSHRYAVMIIVLVLAASISMGWYVTTHIKINTDINQLIASDSDWRKREKALEQAFPQTVDQLVIVVDGDTPDDAENAAAALSIKMLAQPQLFKNVTRPESIPFFRTNGLLFLSTEEIGALMDQLVQAQPLLGPIAADPSLRGLLGTLDLTIQGAQNGAMDFSTLAQPLTMLSEHIESVLAGNVQPLPWRSFMMASTPQPRDLRKFILTQPTLDYESLSPGEAASNEVRALAQSLNLTPDHGVHVRLTGSVALNDEEFASVAQGAGYATAASLVLVLGILFLALHSFRLILPILLTLIVGLIATTAFAMATVGSLNLISVAFAVMFVGIAVDFGIQFGVRYRDQHHLEPDHTKAMTNTARIISLPLALAAGSTAIGFLAFIPTSYRGVAELGLIAGAGMIIAFILNITLLPALLALFHPPAERESIGFACLAPMDGFLITHRRKILMLVGIITVLAFAVSTQLHFDFDPLNLKNPKSESVSTLFDLMSDPQANPYIIDILEPSLTQATAIAKRIEALPEVDHAMTLASFVPDDQDKKLSLISDANFLLAPTINPSTIAPPPSDDETYAALQKAASGLHSLEAKNPAAKRMADDLDEIVKRHDPALLGHLQDVFVTGLVTQLHAIRAMLSVQRVTIDTISDDLKRDWITPDGRAKIEVYPKGNARDYKVLAAFTNAVRQIEPEASGSPISIQESARTIVNAFIEAGIFAIIAIAFLAWLVLRRIGDVIRLLFPLFLAGILTLATMVVIHLPLNFANIIALPLLLSLGVSYAIYFLSYWRSGQINPLQSSMARAVLFSACTTLIAFGSLSLSSHPGTSGMGKLLTVAMVYSLLCTYVVLPCLLKPLKIS